MIGAICVIRGPEGQNAVAPTRTDCHSLRIDCRSAKNLDGAVLGWYKNGMRRPMHWLRKGRDKEVALAWLQATCSIQPCRASSLNRLESQ